MKLREIFEDIGLTEVSMSFGRLNKLVADIRASVGIEFEMYCSVDDIDIDSGPDFSQDETAYSISDVTEFFNRNDVNVRYDLESLRDTLIDEYNDYSDVKIASEWTDQQEELVSDYIRKNDWDEESWYEREYADRGYNEEQIAICEKIRLDDYSIDDLNPGEYNLYADVRDAVDEMFEFEVNQSIAKEDRNYRAVKEDFFNDFDVYEEDFLEDNYSRSMERIYDQHSIIWPYYIKNDIMDVLSTDFSEYTGYKSIGWDGYHSREAEKGEMYVFEKDSSLDNAEEEGYIGIELVSPVLSLSDMVNHLSTVIKWSKGKKCYTDDTCGLHMNVSLDDIDISEVDYVKLALFLGDEYVLNQFNRISNTYTAPAIGKIKAIMNRKPDDVYRAFELIQQGLESIAKNIIHDHETTKYTSINMKSNRVEFRSPGDDWLSEDITKLVNTLNRFVVALDIACDSEKYKEEYAKKLLKLFNSSSHEKELNQLLTSYIKGELSADELSNFVKPRISSSDKFDDKIQSSGDSDRYKKLSKSLSDKSSQFIDNLNQQLKSGKITRDQYMQALSMKQGGLNKQEKVVTKPVAWEVIGPNNLSGVYGGINVTAAINGMRKQYKLNSVRYPDSMFTVTPSYQTDLFR